MYGMPRNAPASWNLLWHRKAADTAAATFLKASVADLADIPPCVGEVKAGECAELTGLCVWLCLLTGEHWNRTDRTCWCRGLLHWQLTGLPTSGLALCCPLVLTGLSMHFPLVTGLGMIWYTIPSILLSAQIRYSSTSVPFWGLRNLCAAGEGDSPATASRGLMLSRLWLLALLTGVASEADISSSLCAWSLCSHSFMACCITRAATCLFFWTLRSSQPRMTTTNDKFTCQSYPC